MKGNFSHTCWRRTITRSTMGYMSMYSSKQSCFIREHTSQLHRDKFLLPSTHFSKCLRLKLEVNFTLSVFPTVSNSLTESAFSRIMRNDDRSSCRKSSILELVVSRQEL